MKETNYFIAIIKPKRDDFLTNPDNKEMAIMSDHFLYLKNLMQKGLILLAGPTLNNENPFGIIILNITSKKEAQRLLNHDPSIKQNIQQLVELEPFKVSLFKQNS